MRINATKISTTYEDGIQFIGFLEENGSEFLYFHIQDALEYDKQDMNTYYIEKNDQGYSGYGGILKIELNQSLLKFELDEIGKKNLQEDYIEISMEIDTFEFNLLQQALTQLVKKHYISSNLP